MQQYIISFLAISESLSFKVTSPIDDGIIDEFIKDLIFIFSTVDVENHKILVEAFQANTPETRTKIEAYVNKYKDFQPKLHEINSFFKKLEEDEHFLFFPNVDLDSIDRLKYYDYLKAVKENRDFEEVNAETNELFGFVLANYRISAFGDKRISIGESDKTKRTCRFCGKSQPQVSFKNKAHAISEGLGNKTVVLLDECDDCNKKFSESIEPDIIQYLSIYRTFFEVKGKGGEKQWHGENLKIKKEKEFTISIFSTDDPPEREKLPYKIKLEGNYPITSQNIYKTLCKYFTSVIPAEELVKFRETIDWMNGTKEIKKLPKLAQMISYHAFTRQPKLITYLRKTDDKTIPYAIGEFYFTCLVIVFLVPVTSEDELDFTKEEEYEQFWASFKHYDKSKGWVFYDMSSSVAKKFIKNINVEKRK